MTSITARSKTAQDVLPQTDAQTENDFPIVSDYTTADQRHNKYVYPLFDGFSGERYLRKLLEQILPAALFRTWSHAISFQAPGNVCYVGTAKIAEQVKPGIRKIEIDLLELERRGLMRRYTDRLAIPQGDGSFVYRAVVVKDFTALYDFAYSYHLWINSPEYVPASREHEDFFRNNPQLCEVLIKYDNYRRIFTCQKPGRKPMVKPQPVAYQCQYSPDDQSEETGEVRTDALNTNNYFQKQKNVSSSYREPKKEEGVSPTVSFSSFDLKEGGLESEAIRNDISVQQSKTNEDTVLQKNARTDEKVVQNDGTFSPSNQSNDSQEKEIHAEDAKGEKEYNIEDLKKNPFAMAAFLVEMQGQMNQQQQPKSAKPKQEKRKRRGTPEQLAEYITYIVQRLGENPKSYQSDITRVTKIYWAATQIFNGFRNDWFLDKLREAFIATMKARKVKLRVPYFFTTLENELELTLEEKAFIRSSEPLYKDGNLRDFVHQIHRMYEKSNSDVSYEKWIQRNYRIIGSTYPLKPIV